MQTFLNVQINNSIGNKEEEEEGKTIKPEKCNKSDRLDFSEIAFYSDHDFCCNHRHLHFENQIDLKIVRQSWTGSSHCLSIVRNLKQIYSKFVCIAIRVGSLHRCIWLLPISKEPFDLSHS